MESGLGSGWIVSSNFTKDYGMRDSDDLPCGGQFVGFFAFRLCLEVAVGVSVSVTSACLVTKYRLRGGSS